MAETKDLKEGEESPTGADQTGATGPSGASGATGATGASGASGASDDQVQISKSELKKLRKDSKERDNLSKAVIRLNKKIGRVLPGSEPIKKKKKDDEGDDFGATGPSEDKFVTKKELAMRDEKRAINKACDNEELALNWEEVIAFYIPPKTASYESQLAAILKAHKLWRADKGITGKSEEDKKKEEEEKKAKKAKKDLSNDEGLDKGKEKKPTSKRKVIIPRKTKMDSWYPDPDKKK